MAGKTKTVDNKCPSCNAPLEYKAGINKWKCDYCDSEFTLEDLKKYNNASSEASNAQDVEEANEELTSYKCESCGAEIVADDSTSSTFCVYCGNTAILKNKLVGKFAPNKLIPFKKEQQVAIDAFKGLNKGRPLMPKLFNDPKNIEKIKGVYIPFWLYDIKVSGGITATGTKVTSWSSGSYLYTKTDTYMTDREGSMKYNLVPVDGSTHFENDLMNALEPFNFEELEDYNHAYLSGFLAEKYDVESADAFPDADKRVLTSTKDEMLTGLKGCSGVVTNTNTLASNIENTTYALLPVYMVNIKYNNELHIFAMNGQTGELVGKIPIDKQKAVKYAIGLFILGFISSFIFSFIAYIMKIEFFIVEIVGLLILLGIILILTRKGSKK